MRSSPGGLPESEYMPLFAQIALGVEYLHSQRVLHRDLKSQNIFLLGNGRLVLGDLGISKVLDGTLDMARTKSPQPLQGYTQHMRQVCEAQCIAIVSQKMHPGSTPGRHDKEM